MPKQIKAIIFDCDGTLVDSEEAHLDAWRHVLHPFGHKITQEEAQGWVGKCDHSVAKLLSSRLKTHTSDALLREKQRHFAESMQKGFPAIEGTVRLLRQLIAEKDTRGVKLAVASAAFKEEIWGHLRGLNCHNDFDLVLSGAEDLIEYSDPAGVNKPQPYIYQHAAKLLDVETHECVVIEDSHIGVTAATRAGCFTVAVPTAGSKRADLSAAHLHVHSLGHFTVDDFLKEVHSRKNSRFPT